jgi:hypothetical protein
VEIGFLYQVFPSILGDMPYRSTVFIAGNYYHLYNRGNNREPIFFERESFIYLNPQKANLTGKAEDWDFSSYRDYLGIRKGTLPKPDVVLSQFPSPAHYKQFVEDGNVNEKIIANITLDG